MPKIASVIGRPNAFRAVGQANHDNPIAIIIPCHRVLGAKRHADGFTAGGLTTKEKLLRLEGGQVSAVRKTLRKSSGRQNAQRDTQASLPY